LLLTQHENQPQSRLVSGLRGSQASRTMWWVPAQECGASSSRNVQSHAMRCAGESVWVWVL